MISSVKQAIVDKLLECYQGYTIYDEDVPQSFKTPSFLITLIDQEYRKRINDKFDSVLSFDVAYFSDKENTEIKSDCFEVQLNLFRAFDLIGTFRVLNKQAIITDNVLHFTFEIRYSEINDIQYDKMQRQQTNTRTEG